MSNQRRGLVLLGAQDSLLLVHPFIVSFILQIPHLSPKLTSYCMYLILYLFTQKCYTDPNRIQPKKTICNPDRVFCCCFFQQIKLLQMKQNDQNLFYKTCRFKKKKKHATIYRILLLVGNKRKHQCTVLLIYVNELQERISRKLIFLIARLVACLMITSSQSLQLGNLKYYNRNFHIKIATRSLWSF